MRLERKIPPSISMSCPRSFQKQFQATVSSPQQLRIGLTPHGYPRLPPSVPCCFCAPVPNHQLPLAKLPWEHRPVLVGERGAARQPWRDRHGGHGRRPAVTPGGQAEARHPAPRSEDEVRSLLLVLLLLPPSSPMLCLRPPLSLSLSLCLTRGFSLRSPSSAFPVYYCINATLCPPQPFIYPFPPASPLSSRSLQLGGRRGSRAALPPQAPPHHARRREAGQPDGRRRPDCREAVRLRPCRT